MTFTEIQTAVTDACGLSSTTAQTRIGKSINRHYRRVTSLIGMEPIRFVTKSANTTTTQRTVQFTGIEKIDRVIDLTTATALKVLEEVSLHDIRITDPKDAPPTKWATYAHTDDDVTIIMDNAPTAVYALRADGTSSLADISGSTEPAFPESYHDILAWYVIAEELLRKEKPQLAKEYEMRAEKLLSDLRFQVADSPTRRQQQNSDRKVLPAWLSPP